MKRLLTESNENYSSESSKIVDLQNEIKNIKAKNEHCNRKIIKVKNWIEIKMWRNTKIKCNIYKNWAQFKFSIKY